VPASSSGITDDLDGFDLTPLITPFDDPSLFPDHKVIPLSAQDEVMKN
jgi:hypothetical protein